MHLAFDGERGLREGILIVLRAGVHDLERTDGRVIGEEAACAQCLTHERRHHVPVVAEIDLQGATAALGLGGVVVVADEGGVAQGLARRARPRRERTIAVDDACIDIGAGDIIDVAGIVLVPADETYGRDRRERDIDESFGLPALSTAVGNRIAGQIVARFELGRVRLVADDADGARFRTCTVQGALRSFQHFYPLDVIHMHVDRAVDRRHRLLVEIRADGRLRTGMVAILAAVDAAHVDVRRADAVAALPDALDGGDAGQVFDVIVQVGNIELLDLLCSDRLDAHRHVLQVLRHFLRGDGDLFERIGARGLRRGGGLGMHHGHAAREDCRNGGSERQSAQ